MAEKNRKLSIKERIEWFIGNCVPEKKNPLRVWKEAVAVFEAKGYTYDSAVEKALNYHNVPTVGKVVSRGTEMVRVV